MIVKTVLGKVAKGIPVILQFAEERVSPLGNEGLIEQLVIPEGFASITTSSTL